MRRHENLNARPPDEGFSDAPLSEAGARRRDEILVAGRRALSRRVLRRRGTQIAILGLVIGALLLSLRTVDQGGPDGPLKVSEPSPPVPTDGVAGPDAGSGLTTSPPAPTDRTAAPRQPDRIQISPRIEISSTTLARVEIISDRTTMSAARRAEILRPSRFRLEVVHVRSEDVDLTPFQTPAARSPRIEPVQADNELLGLLALAGQPSALLRTNESLVVLPLALPHGN